MTDTEIIRRVEQDILDPEFRKFNLRRRRSMLAVGHLLKVFGDSVRDLNRGIGVETFEQARFRVNFMTYALGHCLRWLAESQVSSIAFPDERWETIDNEAAEFLRWGIEYTFIANDHTAWSRGLMTASVDHATSRIAFRFTKDTAPAFFVRPIEAQQRTIHQR